MHSSRMYDEYSTEYRTGEQTVADVVHHTEKSKLECEISEMLLSFLALSIHASRHGSPTDAPSHNEWNEAVNVYASLVSLAAKFCDSDLSQDRDCSKNEQIACQHVKTALEEYCEQTSETQRTQSLSIALNSIVSAFQDDASIEALPTSKVKGLFIQNKPAIIKSAQLDEIPMPKSAKRKPDIVFLHPGSSQDSLSDISHSQRDLFPARIALNADTSRNLKRPATWLDIAQSWELAAVHCIDHKRLRQSYTSTPNQPSISESSTPTTSSQKRKEGPHSEVPNDKRPRHDSEDDESLAGESSVEYPTLTPAQRSAFYATERLRSSWRVTHTIGVVLQDEMLQMSWYDAQGCIATKEMDIIEQLPVFVAMILIFQRFPPSLWGYSLEPNYLSTNSGVQYDVSDCEPQGYFQMDGYRTFTSILPVRQEFRNHIAAIPGQENCVLAPTTVYFKASWQEVSRPLEPESIHIAVERAKQVLPYQHRDSILDHLPNILSWARCDQLSTGVIRQLIGLPTDGARQQFWMICDTLEPLTAQEPEVVWNGIWELIKCHRLLWQIGISHGDISLDNLMYNTSTQKAVLIGFHRTVIVNPGATPISEERTDARPVLTRAVMVDKITQCQSYRRDLEAFYWLLVAIVCCVSKKTVDLRRSPVGDWFTGDSLLVRAKKQLIFSSSGMKSLEGWATEDFNMYVPFLHAFGVYWLEDVIQTSMFHGAPGRRHAVDLDDEVRDIRGLIKKCNEFGCELPDALKNADWLDFCTRERKGGSAQSS